MNFSIKYKLLLTFFIATVAVVGCMLFLMHWSFERGFLQYVNTVELEVHENLIATLANEYNQQGSWDFLKNNRRLWRDYNISSAMKSEVLREHLSRGEQTEKHPLVVEEGFNSKRPPPKQEEWEANRDRKPEHSRWRSRGDFHFRPRLSLLDQDKNLVVGRTQDIAKLEHKPINVEGEIVGYLGMRSRKNLSDMHDLRFTEKQGRAFTLIALMIIIIATILILPLSRHLVKPIKTVTAATRELASGKYDVRIPVSSNDEIGQLSKRRISIHLPIPWNKMKW